MPEMSETAPSTNGPPNAPAATARGSRGRARRTPTAQRGSTRLAVEMLVDLLLSPELTDVDRPGVMLALRTLREHEAK